MHGEEETIPMDLVEEWITSMPRHGDAHQVPRAAHFVYLERPEIVWPAVEKFLSGNDNAAARSPAKREALWLDPLNPEWTKPAPAVSHLRFETTKGVFVLELVRAQGPIGADRLYNLARLGYYDDTRFQSREQGVHRAVRTPRRSSRERGVEGSVSRGRPAPLR
jgi:hypothetical protein